MTILCVLFAFCGTSSPERPPAAVSPELQLLGAIKLWGDIKFFDPQVAGGSVDWDVAFMNAEPAILAATTRDSYAAAIESLLSPLGDPATHVSREGAQESFARVTASSIGSASVITIVHGTAETLAVYERDAGHAADVASKSGDIVVDLRNVTEANDMDSATLQSLFSSDSPLALLLSGNIALPRERSRSYEGYPNEGAGYEGYSAQDSTSDATIISGKSKVIHRFGFLVNGSTSLPSLAIALTSARSAAIYTTGGEPAILSAGAATMELPYGLYAAYRIGDLADVAPQQRFASEFVTGVPDVVAKLQGQPPLPRAYATPPPEMMADNTYAGDRFPDEALRMLAVARIYNVIRYFSPYRALMHDDWDTAALAAIRDERATTDARSYILGLMKFYAHLHDSHGYIAGDVVNAEFGFALPLQARYLRGQAVVTQVLAGTALLHGLRVGDVIDAVDGAPTRQAMELIQRYICSSTPQAANYTALSTFWHPSVFTGKRGTTLTLRFHHPGSRESITAAFVRDSVSLKPARSGPKYFILPGNVGYVDFDRLPPDEVGAMFEALKNTRAIIFDNRGYPLGAAWTIAPRLTTATTLRLALFNTPFAVEPLDIQSYEIEPLPMYHEFYQMLDPTDGPRYLKPTVMLVDERAISQSEHSALFFREAGHTRFVGTPTRGANGDVTSMIVPGGISLSFSGEGVRWPDGKQLQRVGIIPDVRVEPTARDIATGNDVVLQRGLEEALRLSGASSSQRHAAVQQETVRERSAAAQAASP